MVNDVGVRFFINTPTPAPDLLFPRPATTPAGAYQAIQYARDHLSPHSTVHVAEIQRAMATLAFDDPTSAPVPEYAALFADER